jgi:hypothetical protein
MFVTLEFNLNTYINNFYFNFLVLNEKKFIFNGLDNLEVVKFKNYDFRVKLSGIEQVADVSLVTMPENLWSVDSYNSFFFTLLFFTLLLPLVYCLILLLVFLFYQIGHLYFGKISKFEDKTINFTYLVKNYWRALWCHAYDVVP